MSLRFHEIAEPPPEAYAPMRIRPDEFTSLLGTAERLAAAGVELVEMVLADQDNWDRYVAAQHQPSLTNTRPIAARTPVRPCDGLVIRL